MIDTSSGMNGEDDVGIDIENVLASVTNDVATPASAAVIDTANTSATTSTTTSSSSTQVRGDQLMVNFRELLWYWREYYLRRGRDRLSLEFSTHIPFAKWLEFVGSYDIISTSMILNYSFIELFYIIYINNRLPVLCVFVLFLIDALCCDDGTGISLLPTAILMPRSPYSLPPRCRASSSPDIIQF